MLGVHPETWQEDKPLVLFKIRGPQSEVPIDSAIWGGSKFLQKSILNAVTPETFGRFPS